MKYELLRIFPDLWFCHQEEAPLLTLIIPRNQNPQGISGRNISRRYFINVPRAKLHSCSNSCVFSLLSAI